MMHASKPILLKLLGLDEWQIQRIVHRLDDADAMRIIDEFRDKILKQTALKYRINHDMRHPVWSRFLECYPVLYAKHFIKESESVPVLQEYKRHAS